jgi:hypothetical protein
VAGRSHWAAGDRLEAYRTLQRGLRGWVERALFSRALRETSRLDERRRPMRIKKI